MRLTVWSSRDFQLFRHFKQRLAGKLLATDADVGQDVTSSVHTLDTIFFFYADTQALLLSGADACMVACWDLMCAICDPCDVCTSKSEDVPCI